MAACNYALLLRDLQHFKAAAKLLCTYIPVARRALGEGHELTLRMMGGYGEALYWDPGATLDDLHKAVPTLEESDRIARQVLGGAHPLTRSIERALRGSRAALRAREAVPK